MSHITITERTRRDSSSPTGVEKQTEVKFSDEFLDVLKALGRLPTRQEIEAKVAMLAATAPQPRC